jgi:CheY-like chemotaxis protein
MPITRFGTQQAMSESVIAAKSVQSAIHMPSSTTSRSSKPRLLLVDDDLPIRGSLTMVFEWHGYDVTAVADAADAMKHINQQLPDVLVTDLDLGPGIGGLSLITHLRQLHPRVPIVVVSGCDEARDEAIECGARAFIPKPISVEDLMVAIRDATTSVC